MHRAAKTGSEFRHGHQIAPDFLRQGLDELRHLLRQDARYQPLAARRGDLIDECQRHGEGDAIIVLARREVVAQREADVVYLELRRKLVGGDASRLVPHQIVFLQVQQLGIIALSLFTPMLKTRTVVYVSCDPCIVESKDQLVVHQHIRAARLVFQGFDIGNQFLIVRKERRARVELATHQCLSNKYLTRFRDIHRPVMHALLGVEQQTMQGTTFIGRNLRGLLLPMRIKVVAFDQMCAHLFQPFRLDACQSACVQTVRLHQLARHHPLSALLGQHRVRRDDELDAARPHILIAFQSFHADVAEQAAQQCLMYLGIAGGLLVLFHAHLGDLSVQLLVQFAPLAQTQR